jgi:type I restriction enzyme S subunit
METANAWPMVPLGEVLTKSEEQVEIRPDREYLQVTVRLWGGGVVLRNEVSGTKIAAKKRHVVRPQQFLLSRIDARNGAFGLVPESLDGAVVSNDFPAFNINKKLLEPRFLEWLSKTKKFADLCRVASEGTTNRVRLQVNRFLVTEIPLPPLEEQRRIVARIEELAAKVEAARALRQQATEGADQLVLSESNKVFSNLAKEYEVRSLGGFNPHVTSGPRGWRSRYAETGLRFYRAQDIGPNGDIQNKSKALVRPPEAGESVPKRAFLRVGDLMLVITGATVGRCAVFSSTCEPGYINQHVALCRLPQEVIAPHFVLWSLRSPSGQEQLLGQRYGQGKPGLNLTNIRMLKVPFPPVEEQRRIVAYLDALQAKVEAVKQHQAATGAALDALLPSILDRAFKGEL